MYSEKKPRKKVKVGKFQISTWKFQRLLNPVEPGKEPTGYLEKWSDVPRACIQFSTFNKQSREWNNQTIWCSPAELKQLREALDQI